MVKGRRSFGRAAGCNGDGFGNETGIWSVGGCAARRDGVCHRFGTGLGAVAAAGQRRAAPKLVGASSWRDRPRG